jgi:iron(III) transport system ATP-binding protein
LPARSAPNPKLLLLDEFPSNLDAALKKEIHAEMRELMDHTHSTCLFVSHDLDDLRELYRFTTGMRI